MKINSGRLCCFIWKTVAILLLPEIENSMATELIFMHSGLKPWIRVFTFIQGEYEPVPCHRCAWWT